MQIGGRYPGAMCGGGLFLMQAAEYGWPGAMLMLELLIMVLSLPLWRVTEPMRTMKSRHFPSLCYALARSQMRYGLLLVLILNAGMRFVMSLFSPLLLDHGISISALGALLSDGSITAGVVGTLAGGLLMKYCPAGRALLVAYGMQGITLLAVVATLWLASHGVKLTILQWVVIAQSVTLADAFVCLYATLMSLSSPLQAGVDFTLFQCTDAAIAILAGITGGIIAQHFSYATCFLFASSTTLLAAFGGFSRLSLTSRSL